MLREISGQTLLYNCNITAMGRHSQNILDTNASRYTVFFSQLDRSPVSCSDILRWETKILKRGDVQNRGLNGSEACRQKDNKMDSVRALKTATPADIQWFTGSARDQEKPDN
jgi:hypothetical protein